MARIIDAPMSQPKFPAKSSGVIFNPKSVKMMRSAIKRSGKLTPRYVLKETFLTESMVLSSVYDADCNTAAIKGKKEFTIRF